VPRGMSSRGPPRAHLWATLATRLEDDRDRRWGRAVSLLTNRRLRDSQKVGLSFSLSPRTAGHYVLSGQIAAPDGAPDDGFGASVSLSALGNIALIGAIAHDGDEGAANAFVRGAHGLSEEREFIDPGLAGSAYGLSVSEAPDGLTGVVGAPLGNDVQGAAYVVSERDGSQQELVAGDAAEGSFFGISVSMNVLGTRVLVGSPFANLGDGAAYVYDISKGGWTQSQELVQQNPSGSDAFGYSVALAISVTRP
jgi:FG-GAP repeat